MLQVWDVVQHGYWHARSLDYIGSERSHLIEWLRLPGDLVFILFGAVPLVIASVKGYLGVRAVATDTDLRPGCVKAGAGTRCGNAAPAPGGFESPFPASL